MKYTVTIQPSGHTFEVAEDQLILDAALEQSIALPYGCRNGACGSCRTRVVTGMLDYRDGELPSALNHGDAEDGYALICKATATSDLVIEAKEIGAAKDIEIKTLPTRVVEKKLLNHDIVQVKLKLPASARLQFLAGQYIEILLKNGESRSFSLANAPHDDEFIELHIRHIDGGEYTTYVMKEMQEKALLRIKGPLGSFFLREESERPIIFLAGGVGFAPIKGIMEHIIGTGIERNISVYWGVRTREDLYMHELAESWAQHDTISYIPVLSDSVEGDGWTGRTGFVHDAVVEDHDDMSAYEIYACGPPVMVKAAEEAFVALGLDSDHLYYDSFEFSHEK